MPTNIQPGCIQHDCAQCTGTMKLITSVEQLEPGREYWLRGKELSAIGTSVIHHPRPQWLELFDIIGPIPEQQAPDFDAYIEQHRINTVMREIATGEHLMKGLSPEAGNE